VVGLHGTLMDAPPDRDSRALGLSRPRMEHKPLPVLAWIVTALAVLAGGWMAFDGARALIVGDYVTPQEGEYAGELGPWAALLESVGLEPRST
jgi:hypothetical protein